jgi:uncharacterized membrane protein
MAHRTGDSAAIAGVTRIVVIAGHVFTTTAVVLQPIAGCSGSGSPSASLPSRPC